MNLQKLKKYAVSLLVSGILALEISLLLDAVVVFFEMRLTPVIFVAMVALLTVAAALCKKLTNRKKLQIAAALFLAAAVICGLAFGVWSGFQKNAPYMAVDTGKEKLYANRSVMVIVPHQDDEANILAGVLEEFVNYGSDITVVYTTNGDARVPAELRMRDAFDYCASVGIPAENVIFLGYGDQWQDPQPDIYNAQPEEVLVSRFGASETYCKESQNLWRGEKSYTRNHICEDIRTVILSCAPDIIFCIDNDPHIGHISTSLLFEEVMDGILRENTQYRPLVMKGFAYGTAWYAQNDYFALNMLGTQDPFIEPYYQSPAVYEWEERLRLPVDAGILSRSMLNSEGFEKLKLFASQTAARESAPLIINGDKVFWQRRTDSLCYAAEIRVSSGEGGRLCDFKLLDNRDIKHQDVFYDGVWTPAAEDTEKIAFVELQSPTYVHTIVLYDHPSLGENILDAVITFDDGTSVHTGPLRSNGAATEIPVQKENVSGFTVTLAETNGSNAGLSEIEAFSTAGQGDLAFVKLMDAKGDFIYDYYMGGGKTAVFSAYLYGDVPGLESGKYVVKSSNPGVTAEISNGRVSVVCPRGETAVITISCEEAQIQDSVYIRNPGRLHVFFVELGQRIENFARFRFGTLMGYWFGIRIATRLGIAS